VIEVSIDLRESQTLDSRVGKVVCKSDRRTLIFTVFAEALTSNHYRNRGFGDKVVGEGSQEDAFERGTATAAEDDEGRVEGVDLF